MKYGLLQEKTKVNTILTFSPPRRGQSEIDIMDPFRNGESDPRQYLIEMGYNTGAESWLDSPETTAEEIRERAETVRDKYQVLVREGETRMSERLSPAEQERIREKEVKNVVVDSTKEKLPTNRDEALALIPEGGKLYRNEDQDAMVRVGRKALRHSALHNETHVYKAFGKIEEIIGNAVKIGEEAVDKDEIGHTHSVGIFYTPVSIDGIQYSARLVIKQYENRGMVLDELSLYNVSLHKEMALSHTNLNASQGSGAQYDNAKSGYKVKDLIHSTQENDKKILGISGKTRFSFVGEEGLRHVDEVNGDNRMMDYLRQVKEMQAAGASAEDIWQATSLQQGADGKWRVEAPDLSVDKRKLKELSKSHAMTLGELCGEDSTLFRIYPELSNTLVCRHEFPDERTVAGYVRQNNTILVSPKGLKSAKKLNSTLAHEIQHVIQKIEGFARGGGVGEFEDARTEYARGSNETRRIFDYFGYTKWRDKITTDEGLRDRVRKLILSIPSDIPDVTHLYHAFLETQDNMNPKVKEALKTQLEIIDDNIRRYNESTFNDPLRDPFETYYRLAGEVEARNVEHRLKMSFNKRRSLMAEDTEDIPRSKQFVRFSDITPMNEEEVRRYKPVGRGVFGEQYDQFLGEPARAASFLMAKRGGEALGVFHRDELGEIDLPWGSHEEHYGLEHIIIDHIIDANDFESVNELITVMNDVINNGKPERLNSQDKTTFVKNGYRVSVNKQYRDESGNVLFKKNWVVTAFDTKRKEHTKRRSEEERRNKWNEIFENKEKTSPRGTLTTPPSNPEADGVTLPSSDAISVGKDNTNNPSVQGNGRENVTRLSEIGSRGQRSVQRYEDGARVGLYDMFTGRTLQGDRDRFWGISGEAGSWPTKGAAVDAFRNRHPEYVAHMSDDGEALVVSRLQPRQSRMTPREQRRYEAYMKREVKMVRENVAKWSEKLGLHIVVNNDGTGLPRERANAKSWYDERTDTIHLVLGNHRSVSDVVASILSEGVARKGLRELLGTEYDQFLGQMYKEADQHIRSEVKRTADAEYGGDVRLGMESYMARLAEDTQFDNAENRTWWTRFSRAFSDLLHRLGFFKGVGRQPGYINDDDLRYILWRSYEHLSKGQGVSGGQGASERQGAGGREQEDSERDGTADEKGGRTTATVVPLAAVDPIGRRITEMKAKHPDTIIMARDGDGFELRGRDAEDVAKLMGMSTEGGGGRARLRIEEGKIEMALIQAVKAGRRVAVMDEVKEETEGARPNSVAVEGAEGVNPKEGERPNSVAVEEKTEGKSYNFGKSSLSLQRDNAEAVETQRRSLPPTAAWREGVEKVTVHTTLASVKKNYGELHSRAKAGDTDAAEELVAKVAKPEKVKAIAQQHPNAVVAFVHAEEMTGRNQIPAQYAIMFEKAGLTLSPVFQTNRPGHTDTDKVGRFVRRARFDGEVEAGREYILVDDHVTMGGTLRDLKDYIESKGGKVVAVSTLTASAGGTFLRPTQKQIEQIKERGITDEQLRELGIADNIEGLTKSEARQILVLADARRTPSTKGGRSEVVSEGTGTIREALRGQEPVPLTRFSEAESPIEGLPGYSREEVLEMVREDIESKLADAGVEGITIKGMELHGSRLRGDSRPESDLDVVVEYDGRMSEDGLFNILNDEPMEIEGVRVDVNPITRGKSGTLEQYMERSRQYDDEKTSARPGTVAVDEAEQEEPPLFEGGDGIEQGINGESDARQYLIEMGYNTGAESWLDSPETTVEEVRERAETVRDKYQVLVREGETRMSEALSPQEQERIREKEVKNVVVDSTKEKLPTSRDEALALIPEGGKLCGNADQDVMVRVGRKALRHSALHDEEHVYKAFGKIDEIIGNAVKIGEVPVAEDERGHTNSLGVYYTPVNIDGSQYSARLVIKELINKGRVLDELLLYHTSIHKEKTSPTNLSASGKTDTGVPNRDVKSGYKVKDLIHSTQENDKKILGITGKTRFSEIIPTDKEKKEKASASTRVPPESAYGGRAVTPDAVSAGKDNANNPKIMMASMKFLPQTTLIRKIFDTFAESSTK